jgi:UDP-N-acetylmuramate dehydrogenase
MQTPSAALLCTLAICFLLGYNRVIVYTVRELAEKFKTDKFFRGKILVNEMMSLHTTMRVGGPAPLFLEPADEQSFLHALVVCQSYGFCASQGQSKLFILGGGSNIIVSDAGFSGIVISMTGLRSIKGYIPLFSGGNKAVVRCSAGTTWSDVTAFCRDRALWGFEPFSGLPGTIGGALYMNARCFEKNVSDQLLRVRYICGEKLHTYHTRACDWGYKKSPFQIGNCTIISADFLCTCRTNRYVRHPELVPPAVHAEMKVLYANALQERREKGHFRAPSAGSVFKNNHTYGVPSGVLIDQCGLKGVCIGGAQVAPWHGNFIINKGNATAAEIKELVDYCITVVNDKKGFRLEPEILFCGRW